MRDKIILHFNKYEKYSFDFFRFFEDEINFISVCEIPKLDKWEKIMIVDNANE